LVKEKIEKDFSEQALTAMKNSYQKKGGSCNFFCFTEDCL